MKKIYLLPAMALLLGVSSCNDDFLEKTPTTSSSEATAFNNYNSIKAYMWNCYGMFNSTLIATNPGGAGAFGMNNIYIGDWNAGYLSNKNNNYNDYAFQEITTDTDKGAWNFSYIYHINVMLKNLEGSTLSQAEKDHWKAVGYFFHSFWYMELIDRFGDIPWIDKVVNVDSEEAYGTRTDRKVVADSIFNRLKWAEENIGDFTDANHDGSNTINKACVQMALSRFTLREGTWRKYHNLGDYDKYLTECVRVSKELIGQYPNLYTGVDKQPAAGYGEMWTSQDLKGINGIILYKEFLTGYLTSFYNFREKNDQMHLQLTQDMVDMYLSKNGLPIHNAANTQYEGDSHDIYDVFRNRDPRLYNTVVPPYKVIVGGGEKPTEDCKWGYDTSDPKFREYIDLMGTNTSCSNPGVEKQMKRLPIQNWNASTIIARTPNIAIKGACSTSSGYYLWKNYNCWELCNNNNAVGDADKPIFKVEEAILNYAEAACELGQFDQAAADLSINKLRKRAGVDDMKVAQIGDDFDPNRDKGGNTYVWNGSKLQDYAVPALLWEVRRERIIELMGEGFGFYDVRRWGKAPYFINRQEKGAYVVKGTTPAKFPNRYPAPRGILDGKIANTTAAEGYLFVNPDPIYQGKGWLDKYYLNCVPLKEITINKNLTQNPDWPTVE